MTECDEAGKSPGRAAVGTRMTVIGIIGAGNIGSAVAKAAVRAGHDVVIANSRGPETLTDLVAELGDRARAATAEEAGAAGDVVVLTIPLHAIDQVPAEPLAGKILIDTNNYYFERDGNIAALDNGETTTSEIVQRQFPDSWVVKGFNHIQAAEIVTDGLPAGDANRRALATASEHPAAIEFITRLYDEFGFDTVDIGSLAESWRVERDRPAYGVRQNAEELRENLAVANRLP